MKSLALSLLTLRAHTRHLLSATLFLCALLPHTLHAQDRIPDPYVLDVQDIALSEALSQVANLATIDLAYAPELVVGKTVTCSIETTSITALLACVLEDTGLEAYELEGGAYLIRRIPPTVEAATRAQAPGYIRGLVYSDSTNEALPGAHVVVKGTFLGDAADRDGRYFIKHVPPGQYVLEASSIGFRPVSEDPIVVSPGDTLTVSFVLDEQPVVLRPVTVVADYNRFTHNLTRQVPLAVQSVEVFGMGVGLLMNANAHREARFQLSTLGNFAGMGVQGMQMSAGMNYTGGHVQGLQIGAIGNQASGQVRGLQVSGVFNSAQQGMSGLQLAGVNNLAWDTVRGLQAAGAFNIATTSLDGLQAAGAVNGAGYLRGLQAAGALNTAERLVGFQVAGAVNRSGELFGLQASGALNITHRRMTGVQLAGAINLAEGDVQGLQASGFLNIAEHVRGVQLGIINVAQSHQGLPLGLFNYVHEIGVRADTWADDVGMVTLAARSGNRHVASFLGVSTYQNDGTRYGALVVGLGYDHFWSERVSMSLDALHYNMSFTENMRLVKLRLVVGLQLIEGVALFAGPTYNAYFSPESKRYRLTSRSQYEGHLGGVPYQLWPGFVAGVRLL